MRSAISSIAFAMAIGTQVLAQTEAEQVASLRAAASNVDRIKLLQDNEVSENLCSIAYMGTNC